MQKFESNLYGLVRQCHELNAQHDGSLFAKVVPLSQLRCDLPNLGRLKISKTPYYKYFMGDQNALNSYLKPCQSEEREEIVKTAEKLLNENSGYLVDQYAESAILVDSESNIVDGNLRAARLEALGATHAVVVESRPGELNYARERLSFDNNAQLLNEEAVKYLCQLKDSFKEWYSPLELGPYRLPKRVYPEFKDVWDFDDGEGVRNWQSTIRHVVPNVVGKTVLDIGCNIGLYSLELARMGASVCGVDRGPRIFQPNNKLLGEQSVPNQAYAIRNVYEAFYAKRFSEVAFAEADLMEFDFSNTSCDLFFSCRVLYHLGKSKMEEIIDAISNRIPEVILQSNEGHGSGRLGKIASMEFHKILLKKCGYRIKSEWAPAGTYHPVVYAVK